MSEHVDPGSKSVLYDLPLSTTVRYNRLSSSRMAGAVATPTLLVAFFFLLSRFFRRLHPVHRWSSDWRVYWRQLANQLCPSPYSYLARF